MLKNIFNYIKDNNFQMKLFLYSKSFQNKLSINYIDYKEKYLKMIGFEINEYLYIHKDKYKKEILMKKYNNFLLKNNIKKEIFEKILFDVLENKKEKKQENSLLSFLIEKYGKFIDIDSPLLEIIAKTKKFEEKYTIYISQENIDKYKLIEDYKINFDKLNKLNIKYYSIYYEYYDIKKLNYLTEINIDFNKVIKMTLIKGIINKNFLFSFKNKISNLVTTNKNLFENMEDSKSLENLYLNYFNFDKNSAIKLSNLRFLSLEFCENINKLDISLCKKLEKLILSYNKILNINILENVNFKELKELDLSNNNISDIEVLENVKFEKLEILNLEKNFISNINVFKNANFQELKELYLSYNSIKDLDLLKGEEFKKIKKLEIYFNK